MTTNRKLNPVDHVSQRRTMSINVVGAQGADLPIPLTTTRAFTYVGAVTDSGSDVSSQFKRFAFQSTASNARDVTIQMRVNPGAAWADVPDTYLSSTSATFSGGAFKVAVLPMGGIQVRLLVAQPQAATDFNITVLMDDRYNREDPAR